MKRIEGFRFLVRYPDGSEEWTKLHGGGGCIGDGSIAALNSSPAFNSIGRVCDQLLRRARAELVREGAVVGEIIGVLRPIQPVEIVTVEPVFYEVKAAG